MSTLALRGAREPAAGTESLVPSGDAAVRGEALLSGLESPVLRLEAFLARLVPERMNPLARTGACATFLLLVAIATGILLLPFYRVSPVHAHASVQALMDAPLTLGLLRSLHRYSSDGAVLFALLHLGRLLLARRIGGPRAIAWATGAAMLAMLVVIGWLGYWLVWDDAGALVARSTARALDGLGLFGEPIERSFLTDSGLSATLFFVVFFAHVLLPLAFGLLLWLHVMKLPRIRLLPSRGLSLALGATLTAACLLVPAPLGPRASMAAIPESVRLDAWYVAPLALAEALGPSRALGLATAATIALASLAWLLPRRARRQVAEVQPGSCNACSQCVTDCPYAAISLVPRAGLPGREELVARVDPSRCVGCGLCSASCEPGGIGLPWMPSVSERNLVDDWVSADVAAGTPPVVAWICEEIASPSLRVGAADGRVAAAPAVAAAGEPSLRALVVPCAGFVHSLTIERALRRGAAAVLLLSCPDGACRYREGAEQLRQRLLGLREPRLRTERLPEGGGGVVLVEAGRVDARMLRREAERAAGSRGLTLPPARRPIVATIAAVLVLAVILVPTIALSDVRLPIASPADGELVVSFRHPGRIAETCRDLSPDEIAAMPPHMRRTRECTRGRVPVRLRVLVDGVPVHESAHEGAGLWSDGESVALLTIPPRAGAHRVRVEIADGPEDEGVTFADEREVTFGRGARRVVVFDRNAGFSWH